MSGNYLSNNNTMVAIDNKKLKFTLRQGVKMLKKILLFSILAIMFNVSFAGNFYRGQCTYGVDKLKNFKIDWSGNAKDWLNNAKKAGYKTGSSPKVGAIIVWGAHSSNGGYGHVGIITKLSPLTYKAMNDWDARTGKVKPGVYVTRKVAEYPKRASPVKPLGYIYFDEGKSGVYDSKYVKDITIPDGTYVERGQTIKKTWKLKNTGTEVWRNRTVRIVAVDRMANKLTQRGRFFVRGNISPRSYGTVTTILKAPRKRGRYKAYYQLQGPKGKFGQRVFIDFRVR